MSKHIPNSPISYYNQELKSIIVNNSRIHIELSYFQSISSNSIKSDKELRREIKDFRNFKKRNPHNKKSLDLNKY